MVVAAENEGGKESATTPQPSIHDYSCPICLGLMLRPVKLSCGHRFCRGCWLRVLQGRSVRATAHLTGSVACPFRCEVRPVVPEVDQVFARELEAHFGVELVLECPTLEQCASAQATVEEEVEREDRRATEVNAWAAAGCSLTITPEEAAARAVVIETARDVYYRDATARALGRRYRAEQEKLHRETRRGLATLTFQLPHCLCHPMTSWSRASCHLYAPKSPRVTYSLTTPGETEGRSNNAVRGVLVTHLHAPGHTALGRDVPKVSRSHNYPARYKRAAHPGHHRGSARASGCAPPLHHGVSSVAPSPHGADWRGGTLLRRRLLPVAPMRSALGAFEGAVALATRAVARRSLCHGGRGVIEPSPYYTTFYFLRSLRYEI